MSLKHSIKTFYQTKIEKKSATQIRIEHLKKIGMEIGEGTWIVSNFLETNEPYLIKIGKNCLIADGVRLLTHDASAVYYLEGASDLFGEVTIGNNVFIGLNAIVMPGVTIADNCIIGAGSVVTKSFHEKGSVIAGNPAKVIGYADILKTRHKDHVLNSHGKTFGEKKRYLLENKDKFIYR